MTTKTILAKTPARIDLAGGTLDMWPIYLFLNQPLTINLAINLFAETRLEIFESSSFSSNQITISAKDQNAELSFSWDDLDQNKIHVPPQLQLHYKLLRFFYHKKKLHSKVNSNLRLVTQAQSPAGAGLGGSSVLSISIAGALNAWAFSESDAAFSREDLISIARDIETTVIEVPAGLQDYYAGAFGGLQTLKWGVSQQKQSYLSKDLFSHLEDRILLFYSGKSRNSGINNWALYKSFIDQDPDVFKKFEKINYATQLLEKALLEKDWKAVGSSIQMEWETRKTLGHEITTPEINQAFQEALEISNEKLAGKICGAGGGGCFFVYLPHDSQVERDKLKSQIKKIFQNHEMRLLEFQAATEGLHVEYL